MQVAMTSETLAVIKLASCKALVPQPANIAVNPLLRVECEAKMSFKLMEADSKAEWTFTKKQRNATVPPLQPVHPSPSDSFTPQHLVASKTY